MENAPSDAFLLARTDRDGRLSAAAFRNTGR
jgi:hypothetical protein